MVKPEVVELSQEEASSLEMRIRESRLDSEDIELVCGVIHFVIWLQSQLATAKISLKRIKGLFGFSSEKKSL